MGRDPSGCVTLEELSAVEGELIGEEGVSLNYVSQLRGVALNNANGKAWEKVVETTIQRVLPNAKIIGQRLMRGPGGRRVFDYLVKIGDKVVIIEAKTHLPLGGGALVRLISQLKTFSVVYEAFESAEVIVVAEAEIEAELIVVNRILGELAKNPEFQVLGAVKLVQGLAKFVEVLESLAL
jgi:hypothetical protein